MKVRMLYDLEFNNGFLKKGQVLDVVRTSPPLPASKQRIFTVSDSKGTEHLVFEGEVEVLP